MPRQRTLPREAFLEKLNIYVAEHIARARGGTKISREAIARQLGGYHRVTLYKWLSGSSAIPKEVLQDLCRLVGLSDEERYELLWLGGYIEAPAPLSSSAKAFKVGNDAYVADGEDNLANMITSHEQIDSASSGTSTLLASPMPTDTTTPTTAGFTQRCADLAGHISQTLEAVKEYEDRQRLTDDPRTQRRIMRAITDLRAQLVEYEREQRALGCPQRGMS